ncbi:hypothetical protein [Mycolicibacterium sp.]|uniref:hypothetical protein n=1 Tax=Mycolicibacterium sp. TaxID=2320850 RepID=UPI0037CB5960
MTAPTTMTSNFKDELCAEFTGRVDALSLHLTDPGTDGSNDSPTAHAALTWTTPIDGVSYAVATFTELSGDFTHVGLWGQTDTTFRMGIPCPINFSTAADVAVMVVHEVNNGAFVAAVAPA